MKVYTEDIKLIGGLYPADKDNPDGSSALINSPDVQVASDGTRLDTKLAEIMAAIGGDGSGTGSSLAERLTVVETAVNTTLPGNIATAKGEVIGTNEDTSSSDTVKGSKKYTDAAKAELLGTDSDLATANTIKGLRKAVDDKIANPATAGTQGQVLTLDSNGDPTWQDTQGITVDTELSDTSENPLQNKAIYSSIEDLRHYKANNFISLDIPDNEHLVFTEYQTSELRFTLNEANGTLSFDVSDPTP